MKNRMLFIALLSLCAAPSTALAQFEGVVVLSMFADGKPTQDLTQSIKGTMMRMDMKSQAGAMSVILNVKDGTMVSLMHQQKMYMSMNMKAIADRFPGADQSAPPSPPKISKTGAVETIAGRRCEHYLLDSDRQDMDLCIAQGMGSFGLGGGQGPMGMGASPMPQLPPGYEQLAAEFKDGAFPLKMERVDGATRSTVMMVKSVEAKALDGALFQPPSDYTAFQLPQYPRR